MGVYPETYYVAQCEDEAAPAGGEPTAECEWASGPLDDSGDAEIALCVHAWTAHGETRPLPYGYEYRGHDLTRALAASQG